MRLYRVNFGSRGRHLGSNLANRFIEVVKAFRKTRFRLLVTFITPRPTGHDIDSGNELSHRSPHLPHHTAEYQRARNPDRGPCFLADLRHDHRPSNAFHVVLPTRPSTGFACFDWKARTWVSVRPPKIPSMDVLYPLAVSSACSRRTSAPLEPRLSVGILSPNLVRVVSLLGFAGVGLASSPAIPQGVVSS